MLECFLRSLLFIFKCCILYYGSCTKNIAKNIGVHHIIWSIISIKDKTVDGTIMHRLIPPMRLCDAVSVHWHGGLHENKENIKIQSWNISVSACRCVGTSAHAGLDSISLCNPNVRIMYVPMRRHANEHSFKVVSIVLTEIKLCGDAPTCRHADSAETWGQDNV